VGNPLQEAAILEAMDRLEESRQASDSALELHERSLAVKHRIEDRQGEADSLLQIAGLKIKLGRDPEALAAFAQALEIATSLDDAERQVICLQMMAVLQEKAGRLADAVSLQLRALALYEHLQDAPGQSLTLFRLAQLAAGLGEVESALGLYRRALAIDEQIGDREGQAVLQQCLGDLLAQEDRDVEAAPAYRAALACHEQSGNLPGQGLLLRRLIALERRQGRPEAATPLVERLRGLVVQGAVAPVEGIRLLLGSQLVSLADPQQGGTMLPLITRAREELGRERGISLPLVRIQDSDRLGPREYEIACDEESVLLRETSQEPTPEVIVLDIRNEFLAYLQRLVGTAASRPQAATEAALSGYEHCRVRV